MNLDFTFEDLRAEYIKRLENTRFSIVEKKTAEQIADGMFDAINRSNYPSDWLKHNQSLRDACKKFGIKKSSELRKFVKENRS